MTQPPALPHVEPPADRVLERLDAIVATANRGISYLSKRRLLRYVIEWALGLGAGCAMAGAFAHKEWYPQVVGYLFAIVCGHYFVSHFSDEVWTYMHWPDEFKQVAEDPRDFLRPSYWLAGLNGFVERTLYFALIQEQQAAFVALWVGVKTAAGWGRWKQARQERSQPSGQRPSEPEPDDAEHRRKNHTRYVEGKTVYSAFVIGNGLSILFAFVGCKLVTWGNSGRWWTALSVALCLVIGTTLLWLWARLQREHAAGWKQASVLRGLGALLGFAVEQRAARARQDEATGAALDREGALSSEETTPDYQG